MKVKIIFLLIVLVVLSTIVLIWNFQPKVSFQCPEVISNIDRINNTNFCNRVNSLISCYSNEAITPEVYENCRKEKVCPQYVSDCRKIENITNEELTPFNLRLAFVHGESMCPTFGIKNLVLVNKTFDIKNFKIGDIVSFYPFDSKKDVTSHRLKYVHENWTIYVFRGDNTGNQIEVIFRDDLIFGLPKLLYNLQECNMTHFCNPSEPFIVYCSPFRSDCLEFLNEVIKDFNYCS